MNRTIQILALLFPLALASAISAQTPVKCGIEIDGPIEVNPGQPLIFKVRTIGTIHTATPEYRWDVSIGKIAKGEGTDEITIDTTLLGGLNITVTAELTGAPSGCNSVASKTTSIAVPPSTRCSLDQYGDISFEYEKARLDNFVIQIFNSPGYKGLIQIYVGQPTFRGEAAYRLNRAKKYLVGFRGLDPSRLVTVNCGFTRDLSTTLWVVPPGAVLPECNTSWAIPLSEVKFTKRRPQSSKKRR